MNDVDPLVVANRERMVAARDATMRRLERINLELSILDIQTAYAGAVEAEADAMRVADVAHTCWDELRNPQQVNNRAHPSSDRNPLKLV